MTTPATMAVLRVFDVPDEDGMRRYWDAHATNGALDLEPGEYELVLRHTPAGVAAAPVPKAPRVRCSATNLRGGNCGCAFGQCKKGNIL